VPDVSFLRYRGNTEPYVPQYSGNMPRSKSVLSGFACFFVLVFAFLVTEQGAPSSKSPRSQAGNGRVGVYLTSYAMTKDGVLDDVLAARVAGKVDALVINVKNTHGELTYDSAVPLARQIGAVSARLDLPVLLSDLRERGFYLIARQVVFCDPPLARHLGTGESWVPADDEAAAAYNLAIANEVASLGFDEIQFDYIRYPDGGELAPVYEARYAAVEAFLTSAHHLLSDRVALSADVFGRVLWGWNERRIDPIAQSLEGMTPFLDHVSPMLYPSHYVEQIYRDDPYLVVCEALAAGTKRVSASFRPYLQAFDRALPPGMTLEEYIAAQIRAAEQSGANGYLFWHPACDYTALYNVL
jgi:hypothetical protein